MREGLVGDLELSGNGRKSGIGSPHRDLRNKSSRKKMNINPAHSAAIELAIMGEGNNLIVADGGQPIHLVVTRQERLPSTNIANQQFSIDQLMPDDLIRIQKEL